MAKIKWRDVLRLGLLGSVVALYFSMIGMVEDFSNRNLIGDLLNLGHILLYTGIAGGALYAAREHKEGNVISKGLVGLATGVLGALLPSALVLLSASINMRTVFVNVNPTLSNIITFGRGVPGGLLLFVLMSAVVGLIMALYTALPERWRGPVGKAFGIVIISAIFSDLVRQVLTNIIGSGLVRALYDGDAYQPVVAVVLFGALVGLFFWLDRRAEQRELAGPAAPKSEDQQRLAKTRRNIALFLGWGVFLLIAPWLLGSFLSQVLFEIGRFVLLGLGLNIVVGYAGLLDLGYVAFFAFGAYTMGILTTTTAINPLPGVFNFWTALPIVVLVGVFFGLLLGFPVLRMRGDYLAIVTLGFGEIIRILALSDWLAPIMGGAQGILKIPNPVFFGLELNSPELMYYLVMVGSLLVAFISVRLRDSRLGRQWMAMREDEDVAEAMGINLVQTKLLAFAIGAGFSALGGAIFAARLSTIFPHSFNLLISVNALSLIIVGGLGSIPGVIVGAIALVGLPELLREFQEYRLLMYGILLIVMMLIRPEGFIPAEVFKRELHSDEDSGGPPVVEAQA